VSYYSFDPVALIEEMIAIKLDRRQRAMANALAAALTEYSLDDIAHGIIAITSPAREKP
jgi:hypothetical protein